jgi:hypothetical protein
LVGDHPIQLVDGVFLVCQLYFQVSQSVLLAHIRIPGLVFGAFFGIMTGFTMNGHEFL